MLLTLPDELLDRTAFFTDNASLDSLALVSKRLYAPARKYREYTFEEGDESTTWLLAALNLPPSLAPSIRILDLRLLEAFAHPIADNGSRTVTVAHLVRHCRNLRNFQCNFAPSGPAQQSMIAMQIGSLQNLKTLKWSTFKVQNDMYRRSSTLARLLSPCRHLRNLAFDLNLLNLAEPLDASVGNYSIESVSLNLQDASFATLKSTVLPLLAQATFADLQLRRCPRLTSQELEQTLDNISTEQLRLQCVIFPLYGYQASMAARLLGSHSGLSILTAQEDLGTTMVTFLATFDVLENLRTFDDVYGELRGSKITVRWPVSQVKGEMKLDELQQYCSDYKLTLNILN